MARNPSTPRRTAPKTKTVADVPPIPMPAPVAILMARHLRAAQLHFGVLRRLAEDQRAPIERTRSGDKSPGPLADAADKTWHGMFDLQQWVERCAVESGAITTTPAFFNQTPEQRLAEQTLYPADDKWCHQAGKTMPQPGEEPDKPNPDGKQLRVRYTLPGPVPTFNYVYAAEGHSVRRAGPAVTGTPAATVWDGVNGLSGYLAQWMDRGGDSPADLAAAADGLIEAANALVGCAAAIVEEAERRVLDGSLTGIDTTRLESARELITQAASDRALAQVMATLRGALDGGTPALPPAARGARIGSIAAQMDGKTLGQIRDELGSERFLQRQRSRTRPEEWGRYDALLRIVRWCQANHRNTYDRQAHQAEDGDVF